MRFLTERLLRNIRREDGQALAEYGLIMVFIAIACVLALAALGVAIAGAYDGITGAF
jgi:Flp pilus assembly pilin Flp